MAHLARACVAASTPCSSAPPEQSPRRTCKAVRRAELNIQRSCAHWRSYLCHRVPGNLKFCFSRFHRMIQLMFTDKFTSRNAVHRMWRTTRWRAPATRDPGAAGAARAAAAARRASRVGRSKNLCGACSTTTAGQNAKAKTAGATATKNEPPADSDTGRRRAACIACSNASYPAYNGMLSRLRASSHSRVSGREHAIVRRGRPMAIGAG